MPRESTLIHIGGRATALAFRAVPRRLRFRAASTFARLIEPLIARTGAYAVRSLHRTDDLREISLDFVLLMLTRYGTEFDPIIEIRGEEILDEIKGTPAIVISAHMMLGMLLVRVLADRGYDPVVITANREHRLPGTRKLVNMLVAPSTAVLLRARERLRKGALLFSAVDRGSIESAEGERHTVAFEVDGTTMLVSEALVRVAVKQGARVVFLATQMDSRRRVVARLATPEAGAGPDQMLDAFAEYIAEARSRAAWG